MNVLQTTDFDFYGDNLITLDKIYTEINHILKLLISQIKSNIQNFEGG